MSPTRRDLLRSLAGLTAAAATATIPTVARADTTAGVVDAPALPGDLHTFVMLSHRPPGADKAQLRSVSLIVEPGPDGAPRLVQMDTTPSTLGDDGEYHLQPSQYTAIDPVADPERHRATAALVAALVAAADAGIIAVPYG